MKSWLGEICDFWGLVIAVLLGTLVVLVADEVKSASTDTAQNNSCWASQTRAQKAQYSLHEIEQNARSNLAYLSETRLFEIHWSHDTRVRRAADAFAERVAGIIDTLRNIRREVLAEADGAELLGCQEEQVALLWVVLRIDSILDLEYEIILRLLLPPV